MTANLTDKLQKVAANTVTTLAAPGKGVGDSSINVASTTNFPTDTGITIAIRQVDNNGKLVAGTYTEFDAIVASGTSFTLTPTPVLGTDQIYPAGSTTQVYMPVSSSSYNKMVAGLLEEHDQDGTHKNITTDTIASTGNADLKTVITDTISEKTSGAGVSIDSFVVKDGLPKNWDGWVTPDETWTYASASTFTVAGDQTTKYTVGTRLKWTQTTVKYGVVASSTYSSPNTTVTILVNTDYTIANAAISANYYSYSANPQGYPKKFRFTTVITAPGGTAPTYTTNECYFSLTNGTMIVTYLLSNSTGGTAGSGAVPLFISAPTIPPATRIGFGAVYNGGTTINTKVIVNFLTVGDGSSVAVYMAGDGAYNILASDQSNANRYIHSTLTYFL